MVALITGHIYKNIGYQMLHSAVDMYIFVPARRCGSSDRPQPSGNHSYGTVRQSSA